MKDWASMPLRLGLGIMFILHGAQKVFGLFEGVGIEGFSEALANLGLESARFLAYVVGYLELVGGACLILGLFTSVFSILLGILVVLIGIKTQLANGFFAVKGGFEYSFILACACATLAMLGKGAFGIDRDREES